MIAKWLPKAVENPSDIEARDGMATAQYIAGMAFSNVGLGLVHGMAHPLGAYYDIPHGVANALLLPFVMEYNKEAAKAKYRTIAEAMGVDATSAMDDDQAAQAAVDAVKALAVGKVRIPQHLSELGVPESGLPTLAQAAFNDVCTPGNPRKAVVEEILEVYKKSVLAFFTGIIKPESAPFRKRRGAFILLPASAIPPEIVIICNVQRKHGKETDGTAA